MSDLPIILTILSIAALFIRATQPLRAPTPPTNWAHYKYAPFGETTRRAPPHEVTPAEAAEGTGREVTP